MTEKAKIFGTEIDNNKTFTLTTKQLTEVLSGRHMEEFMDPNGDFLNWISGEEGTTDSEWVNENIFNEINIMFNNTF